ncbi:MAG: FIG00459081: hypothetical protein [uncultured Paraburkholderia sp.]|nr:MAG: FIG00459081: hypothetical protein [uncultured Paraburkholderia sp.]CAH2929583.1 MAG: FIG00459081: hypothetical protein [uncultured Paraburkholderia sp.]
MSQYAHNHRQAKAAKSGWTEVNPDTVSTTSRHALRKALSLEDVALTQFNDLLWLMAQESGGVVDLRNTKYSTRGLYQLLPPQYELNPDGEKSFGNAVEECRGGIRYILGRTVRPPPDWRGRRITGFNAEKCRANSRESWLRRSKPDQSQKRSREREEQGMRKADFFAMPWRSRSIDQASARRVDTEEIWSWRWE